MIHNKLFVIKRIRRNLTFLGSRCKHNGRRPKVVFHGPSFDFTRRANADATFLQKSINICKFRVVGVASQPYPWSIIWPMLSRLFSSWGLGSESNIFKPLENKTHSVKTVAMSCFQRARPGGKFESFYSTGQLKKCAYFSVDGLINTDIIAKLCLKLWFAFITFVPAKKCVHLSLKKSSNAIARRKSSMNWDKTTYRKKVSLSLKYRIVSGRDYGGKPIMLNNIAEETFIRHIHLHISISLEKTKNWETIGSIHCDIEVPEKIGAHSGNFFQTQDHFN